MRSGCGWYRGGLLSFGDGRSRNLTAFFGLKFGLSKKRTCFWGSRRFRCSGATDDFLEVFDKSGFSSSKDIFDLSGIFVFIGIAVFAAT